MMLLQLLVFASAVLAALPPGFIQLPMPPFDIVQGPREEDARDAAINIKKLVHQVTSGTLSSVFPASADDPPHLAPGVKFTHRDENGNEFIPYKPKMEGRPFALPEYHAPCHSAPSLTFLILPISRSSQNILEHPQHYATYTLAEELKKGETSMSSARVALMGNVTLLRDLSEEEETDLAECYLSYHPDARGWLPGKKGSPHFSEWARMDLEKIYYVGGFGDTHYIGDVPVGLYKKVSGDERFSAWL
ncbi:hypothetical protein L202_02247 [Cryptococcus amylolentus CBS 6039]|uniref:CREG-like beta-barrel domain-containing protein n=1 Tax=Cryptococcus amylolentus CBS 6039 TaxID=1295533 RepID=A0A1E3HZY3_9TREE|nr:hypothetical protein L202_02247 [Cryptococcus amylolentus CBS 6039]ODN81899.1 hypothetical protein L202_02247 [Cryptococcus amylolentus CBS 6039]